jgi:hypothetical protein
MPEIAVVGNSILGEGFSAKIADSESAGRLRFRNLSVSGSSPRCWYYLLRTLQQRPYQMVVLQIEEFADEDGESPRADAVTDLHLATPLLQPGDVFDFAFSYEDSRLRFEAARGILLKGYVYKHDVQAFLEDPRARLQKLQQARLYGETWGYDYPGRAETLAGMKVDWERGSIEFPPGLPASLEHGLRQTLLRKRATPTGQEAAYRRRWFGRILDLYRTTETRIVFIRVPRGPAVNPSFDLPSESSTIRNFASRAKVDILRAETFQRLEVPEYFSDDIHMNRVGRECFSRMLARDVEALSAKEQQ